MNNLNGKRKLKKVRLERPCGLVWIVKKILNFGLKKQASFWSGKDFGAKMAKIWRFRKSLIVSHFRFLYIFSTCKSYAFGLSFVAFEAVKDKEWGRQKPQMSVSKATYDTLRSHKWQIFRLKVKAKKHESNFFLHISFLDWTEKLTSFCSGFSEK